jgi:predicted ester cyclase
MSPDDARSLLKREISPELYREIRELWKAHSIAEDRRDLDGLIATLTEDCVYEIVPGGPLWRGHDGARAFYTAFLAAFPDVRFDLQTIIIGPQGVFEEAEAAGTQVGEWLGKPASGKVEKFRVGILFPWDPARRKFRGERVYRLDAAP